MNSPDRHYLMRLGSSFVLGALAAMLFTAAAVAGADTWLTYHNDRYGTTIDYPNFFKAQPPPGSDDGISYPAALKQTYDPIVARMTKSLRSGTGFQTP
jgi:hypothetical protein